MSRKPRSPVTGSAVQGNIDEEIPVVDNTGSIAPEVIEPEKEKRDPRKANSRDEDQAISSARTTRIPIGRQQRLEGIAAAYMDPAFYLRFVIDKPGRIATHLQAAYEFVKDGNGEKVTFPSGSYHLHLMKLPIVFRKEDLVTREASIASTLSAENKIGNEEYAPDGASVALTKQGMFEPET